jgi:hypothetical protein
MMTGHSFVRGFKYAILQGHISPQVQGGSTKSSYKDITDQNTAAIFSSKIKVGEIYKGIYTHAKNVVFIEDLTRDRIAILSRQANSLLINIGTNDLACLQPGFTDIEVIRLAESLRDFIQFQVPQSVTSICMGVVPRLAHIRLTPADFKRAAALFNSTLESMAEQSKAGVEPTNMRFYSMRGWDNQQLDNQHVELDPEQWCNDHGIHPRHHVYLGKFAKSVKRALMTNRPQQY